MPFNRFFIDSTLTQNASLVLSENESHHILKVIRLQVGDVFELINGCGFLAQAQITSIGKKDLTCIVNDLIFQDKPKTSWIIAQSLLKPSSLELVVEKTTELGVDELWFFSAYHSDKKDLSENQRTRLFHHSVSAIKQCGRLYLPKIYFFDTLEALYKQAKEQTPYLFYGDVDLKAPHFYSYLQKEKPNQSVIFFAGPEQGFHKTEDQFLKKTTVGVSLNTNVLRAETASIAAGTLIAHALSS